jgi:hypothetical protein
MDKAWKLACRTGLLEKRDIGPHLIPQVVPSAGPQIG